MSKLVVVAVVVVGCARPASGPPVGAPTIPLAPETATSAAPTGPRGKPIAEICPYGLLEGFAWSREVYRGCPPPPFLDVPVTCEHGCPMPCRASYLDTDGATSELIAGATYDELGRMTQWRITKDQVMTATYDGARLVKWEQTGSQSRTFEYDEHGRLARSRGEETGIDMRYAYDDRGNVIAIHDQGLGNSSLTYDAEDRLRTVNFGATREYGYDARGQIASVTRDGKPDLVYVHDPETGDLVNVTSAWRHETIALTYDARHRPLIVTKRRIDSVTGQPLTERWTFHYDCR